MHRPPGRAYRRAVSATTDLVDDGQTDAVDVGDVDGGDGGRVHLEAEVKGRQREHALLTRDNLEEKSTSNLASKFFLVS